jgi:endo-1,4-beta-xylanase
MPDKSSCLLLILLSLTLVLDCPPVGAQESKNDKRATAKKKKKAPQPFAWVNPLPKEHHPALKHATFRSPSLDVEVGYAILFPPSYESGSARRFPVVYYLHGGRPGSEAKAVRLAPMIREAMQGENAVPESIYVFVNGGPVSHYNMPDQPKAQGASVFVEELIPHVDATYRTIASRQARGIEGFSQGGRGTMRISLRYPEVFCSAAAGGGGYATEKKISESGGFESDKLKFAEGDNVWDLAKTYVESNSPSVSWMIYVGTKGFNYENNLDYMKYLDELGLGHEKVIVPDVPHSGFGIYEKRANQIMRFHADNFSAVVKKQ